MKRNIKAITFIVIMAVISGAILRFLIGPYIPYLIACALIGFLVGELTVKLFPYEDRSVKEVKDQECTEVLLIGGRADGKRMYVKNSINEVIVPILVPTLRGGYEFGEQIYKRVSNTQTFQ